MPQALALLFFLTRSTFAAPLPEVKAPSDARVILVVIDGVRSLEWQGKAKTDDGRAVSRESLFPYLSNQLKKGLHFSKGSISNPYGISLPAYSDIFTGTRQEHVVNNRPKEGEKQSRVPTLFQAARTQLKLKASEVGLFSMWEPLCPLATTENGGEGNDFFRSCGWQVDKGYLRPEIFKECRTDLDTYLEFRKYAETHQPRFSFLLFGEGDEQAHQHKEVMHKTGLYYGLHHYHQALRDSDHFLRQIGEMVEKDPGFKGKTYVMVTTDHGRDENDGQWWEHGQCPKCEEHKKIFAVLTGPGVKPGSITQPFDHRDIAPTVAALLGVELPTAQGKSMVKVSRSTMP